MQTSKGHLQEIDLLHRRCKLFPPQGRFIRCEFEAKHERRMRQLLGAYVVVTGEVLARRKNLEVSRLRIRGIRRDEDLEKVAAGKRKSKTMTGRQLLAKLVKSGLVGMWKDRTDIGDSVEFARRLRERAQHRQWK